ncbi:MAG TPA: MFS transporter [bacterium]
MFQPFHSFLSSLRDISEEGYEILLRKPLFLIGAQGTKVRGMFLGLPRNQAVTIYAGILWVIPIAMVSPYLSLYMVSLGLSKTEVGVYQSLAKFISLVFLFLGGYFSDVWGRKKSLVFFDALSWGGYCLTLALASNKWWCVAALFFMATNAASGPAYFCLLSEGVVSKSRAVVLMVLQMVNMAPFLLFFPLMGGIWVSHRGMVTANHEMYWLFTAFVTVGIVLRWKLLPDSGIYEKSSESWFHSFRDGLRQYREAARNFFKKPIARTLLLSKFFDEWIIASWTIYSSLYYADYLGLKVSYLAVLSQGSAYVAFFTLFLVIPTISEKQMVRILGVDQLFGLASFGLLLFLARESGSVLLVCLLSASLGAIGGAFYGSISAAVWMNIMGEKERAKVVAASSAFVQVGLLTVSGAALLYGHVSPASLLWLMIAMRVLNFVLLRRVAGLIDFNS